MGIDHAIPLSFALINHSCCPNVSWMQISRAFKGDVSVCWRKVSSCLGRLLGEKLEELDNRLVRCCLRQGGTLHFGEGCESAKKNRGWSGWFFPRISRIPRSNHGGESGMEPRLILGGSTSSQADWGSPPLELRCNFFSCVKGNLSFLKTGNQFLGWKKLAF